MPSTRSSPSLSFTRGKREPVLTLGAALGPGAEAEAQITANGQIVFHSTGDCGSTKGPKTQNEVADKMVGDFDETDRREMPKFPAAAWGCGLQLWRARVLLRSVLRALPQLPRADLRGPGNHDGMVSPLAHARSLAAYLRNFCADPTNGCTVTPEAGGLSRTAQIQPGVYFTLEAPFVRILAVYSNTLEDPGVIADHGIGDAQLTYLETALKRLRSEQYTGALLFAHHHPPYAIGGQHSSSTAMRQQMDEVCARLASGHTRCSPATPFLSTIHATAA